MGFSLRVNYNDRATDACQQSWCQLLQIEGCRIVSTTNSYSRILGLPYTADVKKIPISGTERFKTC
jgi:hypothetical protein